MYRTILSLLAVCLSTGFFELEPSFRFFGCAPAFAQPLSEAGEEDRKSITPEIRNQVRQFKVFSADGTKIEVVESPLLTYADQARANDRGSLWAFGRAGRPVAFLELFRSTGQFVGWTQVITLAAQRLVEADIPYAGRWTPKSTYFKWQPLTDERPPSERANFRLTQMKAIARGFKTHEFWDPNNSRFDLRLLSQPLHRYEDAASGVVDGAVFCFTHGTNPEILLLLEAVKSEDSTAWQYGLVRMGSAELHAAYNGKEVWQQPRATGVTGSSSGPYWLSFAPLREDLDTRE